MHTLVAGIFTKGLPLLILPSSRKTALDLKTAKCALCKEEESIGNTEK